MKTEIKTDRDIFYHDDRVKKIVSTLLTNNTRIRCEIMRLINFAYKSDMFDKRIVNLGVMYSKNTMHNHLLWNCYYPHLYNIYRDPMVDNLRGAVLEKYVYELLLLKYRERNNLSINCKVYINEVNCGGSVDAFYYSHLDEFGETYECKMNPDHLDHKDITILLNIYRYSESKIKPCIATFQNTEAIDVRLRDLKYFSNNICVYGVNNIQEISSQ